MTDGVSEAVQLSMLERARSQAELVQVPIGELTADDQMVPGEFGPDVIADIRDRGILVPLVTVENTGPGSHKFEVLDGRRRLRAARRLFAAGMKRFAQVPCLVYTTYEEEDAETWASDLNARRSPNPLSDLESIQNVMARFEVDPDDADGFKILMQKTGLSRSTLQKRLRLLDMPEAFIQATQKAIKDKPTRRQVPYGALESIASLNSKAQEELLALLRKQGYLGLEDVREAKKNQTAARVPEMPSLPGLDELLLGGPPEDVFRTPPIVSVEDTLGQVTIADAEGVIAHFDLIALLAIEQWAPVARLVRSLVYAYEEGADALRRSLEQEADGESESGS